MNIILFGFKGCGKTYFGKKIAERMKKKFIDTDALIQELKRQDTLPPKTIREIYREEGEVNFRTLERQAIQTLYGVKNSVIALGGGSILNPQNLALLKTLGILVYLQASPDILSKRIFKADIPAFLSDENPTASFHALYHERIPVYESIQAHWINTDILDEAGVLAALSNILIFQELINGL